MGISKRDGGLLSWGRRRVLRILGRLSLSRALALSLQLASLLLWVTFPRSALFALFWAWVYSASASFSSFILTLFFLFRFLHFGENFLQWRRTLVTRQWISFKTLSTASTLTLPGVVSLSISTVACCPLTFISSLEWFLWLHSSSPFYFSYFLKNYSLLFVAVETILLAFQNYILMLGTAVMIPSMLVPLMGGSDVNVNNHPSVVICPCLYFSLSLFPTCHEQGDKVRVIQTLLFVSGLNTLLQALFGTRLPTVVGGSFSYVIPILYIIRDSSLMRITDPHEVCSSVFSHHRNIAFLGTENLTRIGKICRDSFKLWGQSKGL